MSQYKNKKGSLLFRLSDNEVKQINSSQKLVQICIKAIPAEEPLAKGIKFVVSKLVGYAYKSLKEVNRSHGMKGVVITIPVGRALLTQIALLPLALPLAPLALLAIKPKVDGVHVW